MATTDTVGGQHERRVEAAVRAVLPPAANVRVSKTIPGDLVVNGTPMRTRWLGEGRLRDARSVVAGGRRPDVVVARRISPGAREELAKAGIGWVDETGAAELAVGSVVISRTGQPSSLPGRQPRWTPSVLAVAEALLCGTKPTVATVVETVGLSTGSCTEGLRVLTELGLLEADAWRGRRSARRIGDFDTFLDAYASAAAAARPARATLRVGVTWQDAVTGLSEIGWVWNEAGLAWAATGAAAALVMAPFVTAVGSYEVFVEANTGAELRAIAERVGLRPIEGGRLMLLPFPTVTARRLATEADGLRVAPWPRVYADLRRTGVRGEEAAEHLREVFHGG